jgi:hypothetical protein
MMGPTPELDGDGKGFGMLGKPEGNGGNGESGADGAALAEADG